MNELKPCPFCGRTEHLVVGAQSFGLIWAVWCKACRISGPMASNDKDAIAAWNRRVTDVSSD